MEPEHKDIGAMTGVMVDERRSTPRFHLLSRVDILGAGMGDAYWGGLNNVSRTGVAVTLGQPLKPGQKVTAIFRFRCDDGRELTETLAAHVIWRTGHNTGLEFETPLTTASPALQKAPYLAAHLMGKEAGR
jgi:PilZ domain-containing protein